MLTAAVGYARRGTANITRAGRRALRYAGDERDVVLLLSKSLVAATLA